MNSLTRWAVVLAAVAAALAARAEPAPACGNMASFGSMGRHAHAEKVAAAPWGEGKGGEAKVQTGAPTVDVEPAPPAASEAAAGSSGTDAGQPEKQ